jgi:3-methylcrotonyl-CoA carboxylase alpha subunit
MAPRNTISVRVGDDTVKVEIGATGEVRLAGDEAAWTVSRLPDGACLVQRPGARHHVFLCAHPDHVQAFVEGEVHELRIERDRPGARPPARPHTEALTVPMPARVVKVLVSEGQAVKRGDVLVTLEAMKMELPLKAPRDGTVRTVACREGELVQPGAALVALV